MSKVKCWVCGSNDVGRVRYNVFGDYFNPKRGLPRHYCKECAEKVADQRKKDTQEYIRLKKEIMFERAVGILEKQQLNIYDYQEAIQAVHEFAAEKPDKFDSAYEMIAAIILIDKEIWCELQYKVGRYQCDFHIPSMKVILEIDGDRHSQRVGYDSVRDEKIVSELGPGWNVVRIKTEYLDQNAKHLVKAIESVVAKRAAEKEKRKAFKESYK